MTDKNKTSKPPKESKPSTPKEWTDEEMKEAKPIPMPTPNIPKES